MAASPGGKKVLLFQSPAGAAGEMDPLPPLALLSTDTAQKAEQHRCGAPPRHRPPPLQGPRHIALAAP
ncbi:MAG: hypothetical protein ACPIOQ_52615, partial [Promethearchaeia archaeon]